MADYANYLSAISEQEKTRVPDYHFVIIVTEWNKHITGKLLDGALQVLAQCETPIEHIITLQVPGAFEIPLTARLVIDHLKADAVICLGCIIKGETKHDEYIAQSVSNGIMDLSMKSGIPVILGILTVDNIQQAEERSGGTKGNKGADAAITAIRMLNLKNDLSSSS